MNHSISSTNGTVKFADLATVSPERETHHFH
jgi:hypothetical protein